MNQEPSEEVDVTILMPCLNEERTLPICIQWAKEGLEQLKAEGLSGEILISDNGSSDRSVEIAREAGCRTVHCPLRGYGNALIYGGIHARGRYIVMGDSDASYDFREAAPMVLKLREGFDLVMGNRFAGRIHEGAMPWKNRYIGNPTLSAILNLFYRSGLRDAHCGLRAFSRDAFRRMELTSPGMEFASEMVVKAALLDLKRSEVPITLRVDGRDRAPHLNPWRDGWRHLKFLFMLSPLWLYFIPSILVMLLSLGVFSLLLTTPRGHVFSLGPLWIGDHWMILFGGFFTLGFNGMLLGIASLMYSVRSRCRVLGPKLRSIYNRITVENGMLVGALLLLLSLALIGFVFVDWSGGGFKGLSRIREMVVATALMVTGLETIMGGFLLTLLKEEPALNSAFKYGQGDDGRAGAN